MKGHGIWRRSRQPAVTWCGELGEHLGLPFLLLSSLLIVPPPLEDTRTLETVSTWGQFPGRVQDEGGELIWGCRFLTSGFEPSNKPWWFTWMAVSVPFIYCIEAGAQKVFLLWPPWSVLLNGKGKIAAFPHHQPPVHIYGFSSKKSYGEGSCVPWRGALPTFCPWCCLLHIIV